MKINIKQFLTNKFTISISFLILVILGFVIFFHYRDAVFSKEIVHLEILGPQTAIMGEEVTYTVKYKNNSNFALEQAKIVFELPDYSLTEDAKLRLTEDLENIRPGDEKFVKFTARLLGKEEDVKTARAWMTYVPHNLSARYESTATLSTKINMVPLLVAFDLPPKVEKNKQLTFILDYFSGVDYPLENLSIKVDRLAGFNVISSTPESLDNTEWKLNVTQKGQTGKISITGLVTADAGSKLDFSARLGMRINGAFVLLKEMKQEAEVTAPALVISQSINGFAGDAPSAGNVVNYQITFKNTSDGMLDGALAISRLNGPAFDFSTLQSSQGQVQADRSVYFQLPPLAPGQEAKGTFSIKLKDTVGEADTITKNIVSVQERSQIFETKVNVGSVAPPVIMPPGVVQ